MGKGFKEFIAKGNLIQIAIAFIMGAAFATLVKSFGGDLLRSAHQHRDQLPDHSSRHVPDRADGPQDGEVGPGGAPDGQGLSVLQEQDPDRRAPLPALHFRADLGVKGPARYRLCRGTRRAIFSACSLNGS